MDGIKYVETSVCIIPCWPIGFPLYNTPVRVYHKIEDMIRLPASVTDIRDGKWIELNGDFYLCNLKIV